MADFVAVWHILQNFYETLVSNLKRRSWDRNITVRLYLCTTGPDLSITVVPTKNLGMYSISVLKITSNVLTENQDTHAAFFILFGRAHLRRKTGTESIDSFT